jgi:FkbM family methyltransferase
MFLELPDLEKIYCFEPDEINYEMLIANMEDYRNIVELHNVGIYYGITESNVVGTGDKSPLGYMVEDATKEHNFIFGTIRYEGKKFKLTTLENIIKTPVDLIKIDAEGSEYNIIENSKLLKESKILIISFHNHLENYVKDFIYRNLPKYVPIIVVSSGGYSDVLLEK